MKMLIAGLALLLVADIAWASDFKLAGEKGMGGGYLAKDKARHAIASFALYHGLLWLGEKKGIKMTKTRALLLAFSAGFAYELGNGFFPGQLGDGADGFSVKDVLANTAGVSIGLAFSLTF